MNEGERGREEGIARADSAADEKWKQAADDCLFWVCILAGKGAEITTDDVWEKLEKEAPELDTHEHRAMAGVMRRGRSAKRIFNTGRVQKSRRPQNHTRPVTIWEVL